MSVDWRWRAQVPENVKEQTRTKQASVEVEVSSLSAALETFRNLKAASA